MRPPVRPPKLGPLPCHACGYDMRGVRMARGEWPLVRCPECGHSCDCRSLREQKEPNAIALWLCALGPAVPLVLIVTLAPQWLDAVAFLFMPGVLGLAMMVALPVGHAMAVEAKAGVLMNPGKISMACITRACLTICADMAALFMASDAVMGTRVPLE